MANDCLINGGKPASCHGKAGFVLMKKSFLWGVKRFRSSWWSYDKIWYLNEPKILGEICGEYVKKFIVI